MIAENLEKAEKLFKKGLHKLVIVREEEPANSHPVVNFSGMGIPVMYHEKNTAITELANKISEDRVLIACVQSGNLVLWDKLASPPNACISFGYTVHPAKIAISVTSTNFSPSQSIRPFMEIPQEIKNATMKIRAHETNKTALNAVHELKIQFSNLEFSNKRKVLATKITNNPNAPERAKALVEGLERLENSITIAISELKSTFKKGGKLRLHPLFHSKVVETLLQQPEAPRALGQLSVVNAQAQIDAVEKIFNYQEKFSFPTIFHEEILDASACMTPEQEIQWEDFLTLLEKASEAGSVTKKQSDDFKQMLKTVRELDFLPLWMTRFFLPEADKMETQGISKLLTMLLETMTPATTILLGEMHAITQEMHALRDNLNLFDPVTFDKVWKQLMELHAKLACTDGTIKTRLNEVSPLGRIATYQVMGNFVDIYDSSIKSMKASTSFTDQGKRIIKNFSKYFPDTVMI